MPNCINYNCDELGTHEIATASCSSGIIGGISNLILLTCDHQLTDPSDATQIQAELDAGRAKLIQNVKMGIDKGSPVTVDSTTSCGSPTVATVEYTATLEDYNVSSTNIDFYNPLFAGQTVGGAILRECTGDDQTPHVTWIDAEIKFEGSRIIPNVNTALQKFDATLKWKSRNMPQQYAAPVGITGF